jgi:hypothetical protein
MTGGETHNKEFLRWEVKPIWKIAYPSTLIGIPTETFTVFGVDRGGLDIVRNWEKIHSIEQFNQGFVAKPEDFTFTVAVKERGSSFEKLRRLGIGGIMFDVTCDLVREADKSTIYGDRPEETTAAGLENYIPWLDGFENFKGCIVQREGQTVELATFPVREFECEFLRHAILESVNFNTVDDLEEGDGTYPHLDDLSL